MIRNWKETTVQDRPSLSKKQRRLLFLHRMPVIGKYFKKILLKSLNIPINTGISRNFYCTSGNIRVGKNVGLGDTYIAATGTITIGDNTSFSHGCLIISSTHCYDDFNKMLTAPVNIGCSCWITANVIILPGVTIGDNTVIGAGSVVTRDIPAGVFAAGNPCKVIKEINFRK